ncbi:MAG: hypothetical protein IT320_24105 [Anaerolineae bacterium]|nr:hypothetical protein [Anaerolineae bacterium]
MQFIRRRKLTEGESVKAHACVHVANYRRAPATIAPIVRPLAKGELLTLRGRSPDAQWVTPVADGHLWVHVSQLDVDGVIEDLPVITYSLS